VSEHVRFAGRVTDDELARLYRQAAVFALPGRAGLGPRAEGEGFGLVFIEAGAAGLPVVAGRAGGVPEAVAEEKSGILVDPSDPADVAAGVVRVLRDPALARRLAEGGRARAADLFSFAAFKGRVSGLVNELMAARSTE
jgi:phosphatidylinositol alpha-1,6-mannosyltransferase